MPPCSPRGDFSRRNLIGLLGSAALVQEGHGLLLPEQASRKLTVVFAGAHPDDPESACGGSMARFSAAGHRVVALYLTRGEAGIDGKSHAEAAAIRSREAERACQILGASPVFCTQVDGATELNAKRYDEFRQVLLAQKPDLVFTHWPIDTHRDHRVTSLLAYDAWQRTQTKGRGAFELYYHEVLTGRQTQQFLPTTYVDVTTTWRRKHDAIYAHVSQKPDNCYELHADMEKFRGLECGCERAEAYVAYARGPARLPIG
ncbi:MAG: PIG-L family deacetylase [Bryobacterales bacterium]|nr:PIG-L family deacetylase [Bryobacterales bacterium]